MSKLADQHYYAGGKRVSLIHDRTSVAVSDATIPDRHRDIWNGIRANIDTPPFFGLVLISRDMIAEIEEDLRSAHALRDIFRSEGSSTLLILIPEVRAQFDVSQKKRVEVAIAHIVDAVPSATKVEMDAGTVTFIPVSGSSEDAFRVAQLSFEQYKKLFRSVEPHFLRLIPTRPV